MVDPESRGSQIPVLFTELGDLIGEHFGEIGSIAGISSLAIVILNVVFGIRLRPYGDAFANAVTSDSFVTLLLFIVVTSQIMMFQRISWIVQRLESEGKSADDEELQAQEQTHETMTDGGSPNVPPRDSKGRFKAKDSGGSNFLLVIMAGMAGYLFASQNGTIDPIAGALIGITIVSFIQSMSS